MLSLSQLIGIGTLACVFVGLFTPLGKKLWGNMTKEEFRKFLFLSLPLMFILGPYWMLRAMKDEIFNDLVGFRQWQPAAKIMSVVVVAVLLILFSKLVDLVKKDKLFFVVCFFYGILFLSTAYMLSMYYLNPASISLSPDSWFYPLVSWIPGKFLGWFSYLTLESFGSIAPNALFWAFVASTVTTEAAKKGYGMILFFTQLATIGGTMFVDNYSQTLGLPRLITIGAVLIMLVPFLVQLFLKAVPQEQSHAEVVSDKKPKTGFFEGLKLLVTRPYLLGVFVVVTFYEVIGTIMEYQMKSMAADTFTGRGGLSSFIAKNGEVANFLALFFALVGTSFFMRRFGLRFCLLMFPVLIGISLLSVTGVHFMGATQLQMVWAFFGIMVIIKGLSYALNNASKEVMYIPTSKDVKFKAKGWIDAFGGRSSKATGSFITNAIKASPNMFIIGSAISFVLLGVWIPVAFFVGNKNKKLVEENKIVE